MGGFPIAPTRWRAVRILARLVSALGSLPLPGRQYQGEKSLTVEVDQVQHNRRPGPNDRAVRDPAAIFQLRSRRRAARFSPQLVAALGQLPLDRRQHHGGNLLAVHIGQG